MCLIFVLENAKKLELFSQSTSHSGVRKPSKGSGVAFLLNGITGLIDVVWSVPLPG